MKILALNCGSSSLKYQLYDWEKKEVVAVGIVERIGIEGSFIKHEVPAKDKEIKTEASIPDHKVGIKLVLDALTKGEGAVIADMKEISAVGHRVVHGGEKFNHSVLIDDRVIAAIKEVSHLAPLHNPANLIGIEAAMEALPGCPQVAIFDTAFHQTMPQYAYMYAVPYEWYEKFSVRRYGFHGTSHLYVSKRAADLLGKPAKDCNIITMHIGNGVSCTAIKNGVSVDTTMGLTPLEGAIMGTRCGDIDPAIIPFLIKNMNMSIDEIDEMLNKKSGMLGISWNFSDHRDIENGYNAGKERETLVINMYTKGILKYIGAYAAYMNGVDVIVFTAGTLENSALQRKLIVDNLGYLGIKLDENKNNFRGEERIISTDDSKVKAIVVPTNEELMIAKDTYKLVTSL